MYNKGQGRKKRKKMFATQTASGTAAACSGDGSESEALRILIQFERIYLARLVEVNEDPELTDDQRTQVYLRVRVFKRGFNLAASIARL